MKQSHYDEAFRHFQSDTSDHQLTVLRDDGVYRHLRFGRPDGGTTYSFHIITYPGGLLYRGDMGDFVFERLHDMLGFFRRPPGERKYRIDFRYWAEKLTASERGGAMEHDPDGFADDIRRSRRDWMRNNYHDTTKEQRKDLWEAVDDQVLAYADDKHRGPVAAYDFSWRDGRASCQFDGLFDSDHAFQRYTHSFMWCCFALVWGIEQYDNAQATAALAA